MQSILPYRYDLCFSTVEDTVSVIINESRICIMSKCNQDCEIMFKISIVDKFSCTTNSHNITDNSCISFSTLQLNTACAPYNVKVEAYNRTIYNGSITEISGHSDNFCIIDNHSAV